MRLEIKHRTTYRYQGAVFLEPHVLRLRPFSDAAQHLQSFDLQIEPQPAGLSHNIDLDGNSVSVAWFSDTTDHLSIYTHSLVETLRSNPFEFLWTGPSSVPLRYPDSLLRAMQPYRHVEEPISVRNFALRSLEAAGGEANAFLTQLTKDIFEACRQIIRDEGHPWPPEETLRRGEGSCRDTAVLFMSAARSLGFAARFVSGYHAVKAEERLDLHAWAEVYLPGGGWRGFDTSNGFATGERYVAIARGAWPELAAPVSATYRGRASSILETELSVEEVPAAAGI